ncbi:hypothetical protein E4U09_007223 [Claviceps aff. purpurea]|uniref:Uncharacterized protein n=1 Tax=Claviceps aff. purpurea TaxID=1967640 RepID=A0A9P7QK77_9HYPO|nr:hypothetical protein E4U09_007223 [Claviceps aff. purpurea]
MEDVEGLSGCVVLLYTESGKQYRELEGGIQAAGTWGVGTAAKPGKPRDKRGLNLTRQHPPQRNQCRRGLEMPPPFVITGPPLASPAIAGLSRIWPFVVQFDRL